MKKFGKIASIFTVCAVLLGLSALATSCSPTFGLDQVSASEILNATFASSYSGSYTRITRDASNGKQTNKSSDDISSTSGTSVKALMYAAALVTDDVYANSDFTHVVYYSYTKDSDTGIVTSEVCYNYYAEN